ncbi:MAG: hypothetical protein JSS46_11325 [Proteobacteria bacterium]|nr:hypothetical protein [Pseudomonadota bacterium]
MAHPDLAPRALTIWIAALAVAVLAYLAAAKPGPWYSRVPEIRIAPSSLQLARGQGVLIRDALVIERTAGDGNAVVSTATNLAARDYARVAWRVRGVAPGTTGFLLWNTDVEPDRVNRMALTTQGGTLLPADASSDPHWLGNIRGIALVLHGELERPVEILGAEAGSGDALETLRSRVREWLGYARWSGSSINTVAGGADGVLLPLPLLLFATLVVASAALAGLAWRRGRAEAVPATASIVSIAPSMVLLFLVSWLVLDARWTFELARHVHDDGLRFAGKTPAAKHLALEDGALFAFAEKARAMLPPIAADAPDTPDARDIPGTRNPPDPPDGAPSGVARVFVVADSAYLRGRAAYLFLPWNVWSDRWQNTLPPADQLRRGDWIVVYQRRGVAYDAATHRLHWEGGSELPADLKLLDHGGALFELR